MARVLGIHGIAQQYKGGPQLTNLWWLAMRGGLEVAGHREVADRLKDSDVRVAFYGDLFRPAGSMAGGGPPYTAADIRPGPERDLLQAWYAQAVEQEPGLGPPEGSMGPGTVAVQVMLEKLLHSKTFAGVARRALVGDLKQVTAFLTDPGIKDRVLERTAAEVTEDTRAVIGHSLGSVVAYEYLARSAPPQVELLITVGSPLGMPNLVFDRLTPAPADGQGAWPGTVARWVNIADKNDTVALRKQLAPLFPPPDGTPPVEDHLVDNGKDPHGIEPHLTSRPAGQALADLL
ncbi:hypothetical protein [Arthrobacter mobilis]|uniref:Alpha/beta hydrolase family protein n=1 Tax=Arthrobacter mobilis TaxID=2724944 RepID=A0A7X6K7Z2_9MICC|nr:hypothetical protein [Arthrobacter mobilis]NKX56835.1 hypothetical protein [Arthrobacter mobilis]